MTARNIAHGEFGHGVKDQMQWSHWVTVVLMPLGVWLVAQWAITQWMAGRLGHQPALGLPILHVLGRPAYPPFAWWAWAELLAHDAPGSSVPRWAKFANTTSMALVAFLGFKVYRIVNNRLRNRSAELHGSAHWATPGEVEESGLLEQGGVIVGSWQDPEKKVIRYLWHDGPAHLLLFAPTRSGKGVGVVLPTLITWRHSLLCLDPKDENFALTSGWRSRFSRVMRLNWAIGPGESVHYNPLAEVRMGSSAEIRDVQLVAEALLPDSGAGEDGNHFVMTGRRLLATAILHVLYRERGWGTGSCGTLRQVAQELAGYVSPTELVTQWATQPYPKGEWHSKSGSKHVVEVGRALATVEADQLSAVFERTARMLSRHVQNLDQSVRNAPIKIPFGDSSDLAQVCVLASKVVGAKTDALEHAVLRGAVLAVGYRYNRRGESLTWAQLLAEVKGTRGHLDVLHHWKEYPHDVASEWVTPNGVDYIRAGASQQLNRDERERGAVLSTAVRSLEVTADQNVAANSAESDFTLLDLVNVGDRPATLYLAVPPGDQNRLGPLVRLFIAQLTVRLMEELPGAGRRHRLLMLLDELPAFGRIRAIEEAIPICAGYGVKLYTIIQNVEQLEKAYGKDSSIFANSEVRSAYAPNTYPTAQLLSNMAGKTTSHVDTHASSLRPLSFGASSVNVGQQEVGRPLIDPGECMTLPATVAKKGRDGNTVVVQPGEMLVFVTGMSPIRATKVQHYDDPAFLHATSMDACAPRSPLFEGAEQDVPDAAGALALPPVPSPCVTEEKVSDVVDESPQGDGISQESSPQGTALADPSGNAASGMDDLLAGDEFAALAESDVGDEELGDYRED